MIGRLAFGMLLLTSAMVVAQADNSAQNSAQTSSTCISSAPLTADAGFNERNPRYQIQSGDSFDVKFEFVPDFDQSVTVQPDGFVTLREIGDVHVADQTVPQLRSTLCKAYATILAGPSIAIILKDFDKPYFIAGGQVGHPGKYTLRGPTSLTEAVAMAGGFTERSKHSQVLLFRRVSSQWSEAKVLNVKKMLSSKKLDEDLFLRPGDMLYVPQNSISKLSRFLPTAAVNTYFNPSQY